MHSDSVVIIDILLTFSYYYFNYFRHVALLQKFAGPLVGPLFVGAPVRPNMLNMPKSASAVEHKRDCLFGLLLTKFTAVAS